MGALAATTALFCLSGKLVVAGFQKIPADVPHTYPALGTEWVVRVTVQLYIVCAKVNDEGSESPPLAVMGAASLANCLCVAMGKWKWTSVSGSIKP